MKYCECFHKRIGCSSAQEVFAYFMDTLKDSIKSWDYFVNWVKVFGNVKKIEMDLNLLNYLIGKENIEEEFLNLVREYPLVKKLIPILVAYRENQFEILTDWQKGTFHYKSFALDEDTNPQEALEFAKSTGFLDLLKTKQIKSVVDYVIGVEVGLDTNGRKNRGGALMEKIVKSFLEQICSGRGLSYLSQANAISIQQQWGLRLPVDRTERTVDFAVKKQNQLFLIETNFYGGGGSKLKATAGEYKALFDFWKKHNCGFIWITDGKGWATTGRPLEETFAYIDYTLNLDMVAKGLLEDLMVHTCPK
ncbi:MAG TPA: type II restriction endonuclease [Anaerohalosphaeraceae bacterium]|nr:type II restriction endonuclease [Anaerohalosphaeraceae bacterium]HOL88237.1 type II restriction endonuclease [Anaerohalosphaeraceae bacterium]HPP56096.1 type II restriction endonuclease [Anaerohalosphaeraceae bacterium]